MTRSPNAKINIGLHVLDRRPDGFHSIESVFYPIGLTDTIELEVSGPEPRVDFTASGISIPGEPGTNLCQKAYALIGKDYPLPGIRLHLNKQIPIGAGLGGGSSDAAFFIKALNETLELNLSWGEMHHYARQLGSDCSFFITNKPAFVTGRGEIMEPVDLSLNGFHLLLVAPPIHISTAEAYTAIKPAKAALDLESWVVSEAPQAWKGKVLNDFEKSVFQKYPELAGMKETLYGMGALYASMTGSGSALYGIFEAPAPPAGAFKNCFTWSGPLR